MSWCPSSCFSLSCSSPSIQFSVPSNSFLSFFLSFFFSSSFLLSHSFLPFLSFYLPLGPCSEFSTATCATERGSPLQLGADSSNYNRPTLYSHLEQWVSVE